MKEAMSFPSPVCLPFASGFSFSRAIDLSGMTEYNGIRLASGASVTRSSLLGKALKVSITDFGAVSLESRSPDDTNTHAIQNTEAVNQAIVYANKHGGGTVIVPEGTFRCYTIVLRSNVNLSLSKGSVIEAARTEVRDPDGQIVTEAEDFYADGTPGNYLQPEINIYAGLQDGGHTYFANSLIYAVDSENIMIYGEGRISGSQTDTDGVLVQVLRGDDPENPAGRTGQCGKWFGNKGIALLRCKNVVLCDFDLLNCGHFAIINEGTSNMLVDGLIVDTVRDAFNIDCGQDVTIRNSIFNSLTDDGIVFKSSYGAGLMQPVQNCVVENCTVCGYDAGSVLAETYTVDKQVATDACGPTARIKFGTESTCGYNTVTITNVRFQRSRGFCIEAVDGSDVHDILMMNAVMDTISSAPVYIRIGSRCRYPVTGASADTAVQPAGNVRVTNPGWVIPQNTADSGAEWTEYPIQHYFPAYNYTNTAELPNGIPVSTAAQDSTASRINPANLYHDPDTGKYYAYRWDHEKHGYIPDANKEIMNPNPDGVNELACYADAVGCRSLAGAYNIYISNVKAENVDPRYPVLLAGLVDSKIRNVTLDHISVTFRGGMRMRDAVEQQQLYTSWQYTQYMTSPSVQRLPWLVNPFFAKHAALLPRVRWDASTSVWEDDPYNVPEMPEQYPESSNFGILPAYGLYIRHADGVKISDLSLRYMIADERHAVVLDDCRNISFEHLYADHAEHVAKAVSVTNHFKRHTGFEYVENEPYFTTFCDHITGLEPMDLAARDVTCPESGTPKDQRYNLPTIACRDTGYNYAQNVWSYNGIDFSLPVTVYRPFFEPMKTQHVSLGGTVCLQVSVRNPAAEVSGVKDPEAAAAALTYAAVRMPDGASFDPEAHVFRWVPVFSGTYTAVFSANDGVLPVYGTVQIIVSGN